MKMENKKLEKMMDVLGELEKAFNMKERAELLKITAIGCMFASVGLYATSGLCKNSESLHLDRATEIVDELKKEEEEEEEE